MKTTFINWLLFIILSLIWGSSFMLMKEGMNVLLPYHVASIRILSAGIVLLPFAWKSYKKIPHNQLGTVILSGFLGSFLPAFLFCIAETKVDSSFAGILNALTPLCTIITGVIFFGMKTNMQKVTGVLIGFAGLYLLVAPNGHIDFTNYSYSIFVLIATIFYGINVNMVGRYLHNINSLSIATVSFVFLIIPCLLILSFTGYFALPFDNNEVWISTAAGSVLGIFGTAIASVLYYRLIKNAGVLFASMISYGVPFIALLFGVLLREKILPIQLVSLAFILAGVYIVNRKR